jgi:hypothetical protein
MASPTNALLKYGNAATQPAVTPAVGGVDMASLDPLLQEAYSTFLKTSQTTKGKVLPSQGNILRDINALTNFAQPVKKAPSTLEKILGNRVTRTVLEPLKVLDIPRRVVISGGKELYDLSAGNNNASWGDFVEQVKDPSFGVGKFANTGNKWLDRAVGFAGDVAFDPMTYVTLGAGKFAGAGGRIQLAEQLALKGASEELVQKAGMRGLTGLTAAERAAYDLPKAGLFFGGANGIRIPGTEVLGEGVGRALSKTRVGLGSTKIGGVARRFRSDERLLNLTEKLLAGKGTISAIDAAKTYGATVSRNAAEGYVAAQLGQDFAKVKDLIGSVPDPAAVTHALERGAWDEHPAVEATAKLFESWWDRMDKAGVKVGQLPNYAPRVWTDEGRALLTETNKFAEDARKLFGVQVNELRSPSAVRSRTFKIIPGEVYEVAGKKLTFADNTIKEINSVFQREFGVKVLEDDITKLIPKYAGDVSRAVGNQEFARRLQQAGLASLEGDVAANVVDEAATKVRDEAWKKQTEQFAKKMAAQRDAAKAAVDALRKPYVEATTAIKDKIAEIVKNKQVVLQGDLKSVIDDIGKFATSNAAEQVDLATQGRVLDELIARTERSIDVALTAEREATNRAAMAVGGGQAAAQYDNVIASAVRQREVADAALAELKQARAQLDDVTRRIDESMVQLPTIKDLPEEAQAAIKGREAVVTVDEKGNQVVRTKAAPSAPEQTVEPYRMIDGTPAEYRNKNAFEQFRYTYIDGQQVADVYTPQAGGLVAKARKTYEDALSAMRSRQIFQADVDKIPTFTQKYRNYKLRYDFMYNSMTSKLEQQTQKVSESVVGKLRALRFGNVAGAEFGKGVSISNKTIEKLISEFESGDFTRMAAAFDSMSDTMKARLFGKSISDVADMFEIRKAIQYESLWSLGKQRLSKYVSSDGAEVIRRFESEILPNYNSIDLINARAASVPGEKQIQDMFRQADGFMRQAKAQAIQEFSAKIDPAVFGNGIRNGMIAEYQDFFDKFTQSVEVMRRINSAQVFNDGSAHVWAKASLSAKESLDQSILKVRMHSDFIDRFSKTVSILDSKGYKYDREAVGALVAKEVFSSEINNMKSKVGTLVEAQQRAISEGVQAFRRESRRGASSALDQAAEGVASALSSKTNVVESLVNEWISLRKELNDATRGVSAKMTEADKRLLGFASDEEATVGLHISGPSNAAQLNREIKDVQSLIELAVFGEQSVRPEGYSFKNFIDTVTSKVTGEGNVRRYEPGKLDEWIRGNGLPDITKKDISSVREVLTGDPNADVWRIRTKSGTIEQRRSATVAASIGDQIDELNSRIDGLRSSARLLGRETRNTRIDDALLAKYPDLFEATRIGDDPVAITEKLSELKARKAQLNPGKGSTNIGDIEAIDIELERLSGDLKRASGQSRWQPTNAQRKEMSQLNTEIDFIERGLETGKIKGRDRVAAIRKRLVETQTRLADVEKASWRFTGGPKAQSIFEEMQGLRSLREKSVDELRRIEGDISFYESKVGGSETRIKPKGGYAVKNWREVLFDPKLGRGAPSAQRRFVRDRLALLAEEAKIQQKLKLPNQSILEGRMQTLSDIITAKGGTEAINSRVSELESSLKKVEDALAKADPTDKKIIAEGLTFDGLKNRRAALRRQLTDARKSQAAIGERMGIETQIAVGPEPALVEQSRAANEILRPIENAQFQGQQRLNMAGTVSDEDARFGQSAVDFYKGERQRINSEIDNTRQIGEDSMKAMTDSKVKVEADIKALSDEAQMLQNMPRLGNVSVKNVEDRVNEINTWVDEAYALVDPSGYQSRVGLTPPVDRYGPPSVADELASLALSPSTPEQRATLALVGKQKELEAQLLKSTNEALAAEQIVKGAKNLPSFGAVMKQQIQDGWAAIPNTGIAVPQEINDALTRIMHLDDPKRWSEFWKAWDGYADVFKAYATMSPRFHVRNALSATLMNYADGVSTRDMADGVRLWRLFKNDPNGWLDKIPVAQRKEAYDSVMAVFGSGGGRYSEFATGTNKLTRNRAVEMSKDIGTSVEGSVRLGMALNTIRGGGSVNEAVSRITRIHFNYSQLSTADNYIKKVIPFWTFMSRNIPMQMQMMWTKPKMYQIYASAVRNFTGDNKGEVVPSWFTESGAFKSPFDSGYIKPDLPWTGMPQQVIQATTAAGLLSQTNPALRVPLELLMGKKFFSGAPIREGEQLPYAAEALLPYYNTIRGLAGLKGGPEPYMSKEGQAAAAASQNQAQWNAFLSFIGAPYSSGPTVSQQRGEILRRQALMEEILNMLNKKGNK